ncbi:MAG: Spy/CpxP family protein refolding chaperone [Candidatus Korobacteraceae bacterium]
MVALVVDSKDSPEETMKKLAIVLVMGASLVFIQSATFAQKSEPSTSESAGIEQDVQLLRSDIRSAKKQIIAENMKLSDAQAGKFWPVYDAYTQENTKLGDSSYALVKEYAQNYENMTGAQADSLVEKMARLDVQTATLRQEWIPRFRKVLTGKQAALFFQLDRRINLLLDVQFAANIPTIK